MKHIIQPSTLANSATATTTGSPIHSALDHAVIDQLRSQLARNGWVLLRGFEVNLSIFSELLHYLCEQLSFDPARQYCNQSTQKVDAGTDAVGLHIENGNTPMVPDLVAFYSQQSARYGSQTTVCDGIDVLKHLSPAQRALFKQPLQMRRVLPKPIWQAYINHEYLHRPNTDTVSAAELQAFLMAVPGQSGTLDNNDNLHYCLEIEPILTSAIGQQAAFANALLGPSFNYQPAHYQFQDGSPLCATLKAELADIAEQHTHNIQWQDGDVVLIDNKRVMHGRREIIGDPSERQLCIGMGIGIRMEH